jgi:hypothetical protein
MDEQNRTQDDDPGFFARYFTALDGPEPLSALDLVAGDLTFAILYANGDDGRCRQFLGGPAELKAFTEAGDMQGWSHHILTSARTGDIELALGETRWDDGRRIATFVCVAQLDERGRMIRYLTGRTPALGFDVSS